MASTNHAHDYIFVNVSIEPIKGVEDKTFKIGERANFFCSLCGEKKYVELKEPNN
jgi:hypothetical protein